MLQLGPLRLDPLHGGGIRAFTVARRGTRFRRGGTSSLVTSLRSPLFGHLSSPAYRVTLRCSLLRRHKVQESERENIRVPASEVRRGWKDQKCNRGVVPLIRIGGFRLLLIHRDDLVERNYCVLRRMVTECLQTQRAAVFIVSPKLPESESRYGTRNS